MSSEPRAAGDTERDLEAIRSAWSAREPIEPPELLDRAVLNAARRAVERPPRRHRWLAAFATASVVVLALAVVVRQEQGPGGVSQQPEHDVAAPALSDQAGDEAADAGVLSARRAAESPASEFRALQSEPADAFSAKAAQAASPAASSDLEGKAENGRRALTERETRTPEAWIEELRRLRSAGDTQAYQQEMAEFREAWPDYALPADLLE